MPVQVCDDRPRVEVLKTQTPTLGFEQIEKRVQRNPEERVRNRACQS